MKIWTYNEMVTKVLTDLDMLDETFVSPNEIGGYFNEALDEAEAEIITLKEDYFKTQYLVPVVAGTSRYNLPWNIYANKIRSMIYANGTLIYEIVRYRRRRQAEHVANTLQFGYADDYRYRLMNDRPGQAQMDILPAARETAILAPQASIFAPIYMEYIRKCARIPMMAWNTNPAELCNPELIATSQVSGNTIQTYAGTTNLGTVSKSVPGGYPGSIPYVTGDIVQFQIGPNGTLPAPLVAGVSYYVIALGNGLISLATTLANALVPTPITLTTTGTVYFTMMVGATQNIVNATLIDIPEFSTFVMQWVKCRCAEKQGNPLIENMAATLVQQKKMMVDTLSEAIEDDDTEIEADYSHYQESS